MIKQIENLRLFCNCPAEMKNFLSLHLSSDGFEIVIIANTAVRSKYMSSLLRSWTQTNIFHFDFEWSTTWNNSLLLGAKLTTEKLEHKIRKYEPLLKWPFLVSFGVKLSDYQIYPFDPFVVLEIIFESGATVSPPGVLLLWPQCAALWALWALWGQERKTPRPSQVNLCMRKIPKLQINIF